LTVTKAFIFRIATQHNGKRRRFCCQRFMNSSTNSSIHKLKMVQYFYTILNFIKSRGVRVSRPDVNYQTSLLNIISFFSALGAFGVFLTSFFYKDLIYSAITLYITVYFSSIPLLHHFTTVEKTRLFYALATPIWYCGSQLLIGGYFGQDIAFGGTAVIVYLFFKEQPALRNQLIAYNVILFILTSIYITVYQPLLGTIEYPFDELVVAFLCTGWISIIFFVYDSRLNQIIDDLKGKNKELTQKTHELQRFNYIASHDLKTPLRNIINFIGLIQRVQKKEGQQKLNDYLKYVEANAVQMNNLIESVLEISKIDTVTSPTNVRIIDLSEILEFVKINIKDTTPIDNFRIESNPLPKAFGNEHDFLSLFQQIINNGLKFNQSSEPVVEVFATYNQVDFQIHFKDNGIGIAPQYQEQIFDLFKRLHTHSEYKGSGLGLSLSKKIMLKYNGSINVTSTPNSGATFTLIFPNSMLGHK